jgi:hypothetical protein
MGFYNPDKPADQSPPEQAEGTSMSPFNTTESDDRRLRYDVLCLAHKMVVDDSSEHNTVRETAEGLMKFIDDATPASP